MTEEEVAVAEAVVVAEDVVVADAYCITGQELVSPTLCAQRGSNVTSLIGYTVRLDRRNDVLKPTRGFFVELNQDLAGVGRCECRRAAARLKHPTARRPFA